MSDVYTYNDDDVVGYQPGYLGENINIPLPTLPKFDDPNVILARKDHPNFDGSGNWREYIHYSVATNTERRQPICVALTVDLNKKFTVPREDKWRIDKAVGADNQLNNDYYEKNVWDRGHMARRTTSAWGKDYAAAVRADDDTFYYTNCCLQHKNLNQDEWKEVEDWVEDLEAKSNGRVAVFIGPVYNLDVRTIYGETSKPDGLEAAEIPDAFFKIFSFVNKTGKQETRAYIYEQNQTIVNDLQGMKKTNPERFQKTIEEIESKTGLNFGANSVLKETLVVDEIPRVSIFEAYINASEDNRNESAYEWIKLKNNRQYDIDLGGWKISTQNNKEYEFLDETRIGAGLTLQISDLDDKGLALKNNYGSLTLTDREGNEVNKTEWKKTKNGEIEDLEKY